MLTVWYNNKSFDRGYVKLLNGSLFDVEFLLLGPYGLEGWNFYHNNNLESSNVTVDWYNVNDENVNDNADDNEDLIDEGEARLWIHLESSSS